MTGFVLKLKTKQGQHVVDNLSADETIGNLKTKISELTRIPENGLSVRIGFPPKPLDLSANEILLSALGIINGDTLIVDEIPTPDVPQQQQPQQQPAQQEQAASDNETSPDDDDKGVLLKYVVPADNSCLFTSISK